MERMSFEHWWRTVGMAADLDGAPNQSRQDLCQAAWDAGYAAALVDVLEEQEEQRQRLVKR